jgi:prepilin-type N-terminal cleavage/methylation domain-containing protein
LLMKAASKIRRGGQSGFSMLEMLFATIILLVGLVAVAQLVPASILMNNRNRTDTSSLVFAQREMDQFLEQPLTLPGSTFTDMDGNSCTLGNPLSPNNFQGSTVLLIQNQVVIDWSAGLSPGYSFTYQDPNDPGGTTYDVRWAVLTMVNATGVVSSKRIVLGVRQTGGNGYYQPVTLDTMVER